MKPSLTSLLCSPVDGSPLKLEATEYRDEEAVSGWLQDTSGNRFPIVDGVPLFAEAESDDETFAFKWKLIGDSYGHVDESRMRRQDWYLQRFGFGTRGRLMDFLKSKKLVLDAGTGSGVDAAMFAESEATVVAIDINKDAALSTYRHLGHLPNVNVLQADLRCLPFPEGLFDYISCDQVLHHTPDPTQSFASLATYLRQGGHMAVYVYKRKGPIREFTDDYLRSQTTRMSAQECYEFSKSVTLLGKALSELKAEVVVPADIELLDIEAGTYDVQRLFYWNVMKCFWNQELDFVTNTVVNFDWYHPKHAARFTAEEVSTLFERNGFEIETLSVVPSGISVLGALPGPRS